MVPYPGERDPNSMTADEKREKIKQAIMEADLGVRNRDLMSSAGERRELKFVPQHVKTSVDNERRSRRIGSEEHAIVTANRDKISAWNSFKLDDEDRDVDAEKLENLNDGQAHRYAKFALQKPPSFALQKPTSFALQKTTWMMRGLALEPPTISPRVPPFGAFSNTGPGLPGPSTSEQRFANATAKDKKPFSLPQARLHTVATTSQEVPVNKLTNKDGSSSTQALPGPSTSASPSQAPSVQYAASSPKLGKENTMPPQAKSIAKPALQYVYKTNRPGSRGHSGVEFKSVLPTIAEASKEASTAIFGTKPKTEAAKKASTPTFGTKPKAEASKEASTAMKPKTEAPNEASTAIFGTKPKTSFRKRPYVDPRSVESWNSDDDTQKDDERRKRPCEGLSSDPYCSSSDVGTINANAQGHVTSEFRSVNEQEARQQLSPHEKAKKADSNRTSPAEILNYSAPSIKTQQRTVLEFSFGPKMPHSTDSWVEVQRSALEMPDTGNSGGPVTSGEGPSDRNRSTVTATGHGGEAITSGEGSSRSNRLTANETGNPGEAMRSGDANHNTGHLAVTSTANNGNGGGTRLNNQAADDTAHDTHGYVNDPNAPARAIAHIRRAMHLIRGYECPLSGPRYPVDNQEMFAVAIELATSVGEAVEIEKEWITQSR